MKNRFRIMRTGVLLVALALWFNASVAQASNFPHVAVVPDPNSIMLCPACLKSGLITMQTATQVFYQSYPDDFDFVFVFLTGVSSINDGGYLGGAYVTAKAPAGTGAPNPTHTPGQFGSAGRLKVVGDMYVTDNYSNNPNDVYPYYKFFAGNEDSAFSQVALVGRAMMRYWGAYAQLPSGNNSLLGGNGFWSYYFHSEGSVLGGNMWREMTAGEFSAHNAPRELSSLDLYLMGVTGKETVTGMYYLSNVQVGVGTTPKPANSPPTPGGDYIRSATRNNISIDDIIAANGGTVAQTGPKEYRCAFVLVVPFVPNAGDQEKINRLRLRFQGWIGEQTDNVITMNCRLTDEDVDGDIPDGDQPYCVDGATRCNGPTVERCIAEEWVFDESCGGRLICLDGECVDEDEIDNPRDCNPGQTRCNGNVVERCDSGVWHFHQDCSPRLACYNAECIDPADIPTDGDEPDGDEPDGDGPGDDDCRTVGCPPGLRCTSAGCVQCPAGTSLQGNNCVALEDEDDGEGGCAQTATPATLLFVFGAVSLLVWRRRRA